MPPVGGVIPYARDPGAYEGGEIRTEDMAQHLRAYTSVVVLWGYWVRVVISGYRPVHSNGMDKELFVLEIRPTQTEKLCDS